MTDRSPWFPPSWPGWHYPDPEHPASADSPEWSRKRGESGCGLCGAPAGAMCVTRRGDPTKNHRGRNQRKVSDDGPDEQPGPEMSDVGWTVTYAQHGDHRTATFASLDIAVGFAVDGNQDGTHHVSRITCPDGSVLEGAELRELRLRYELGEWYV